MQRLRKERLLLRCERMSSVCKGVCSAPSTCCGRMRGRGTRPLRPLGNNIFRKKSIRCCRLIREKSHFSQNKKYYSFSARKALAVAGLFKKNLIFRRIKKLLFFRKESVGRGQIRRRGNFNIFSAAHDDTHFLPASRENAAAIRQDCLLCRGQ